MYNRLLVTTCQHGAILKSFISFILSFSCNLAFFLMTLTFNLRYDYFIELWAPQNIIWRASSQNDIYALDVILRKTRKMVAAHSAFYIKIRFWYAKTRGLKSDLGTNILCVKCSITPDAISSISWKFWNCAYMSFCHEALHIYIWGLWNFVPLRPLNHWTLILLILHETPE